MGQTCNILLLQPKSVSEFPGSTVLSNGGADHLAAVGRGIVHVLDSEPMFERFASQIELQINIDDSESW
jgi:hypothetical protein